MSLWKGSPGATPAREVEAQLRQAAALDPRLAKARFQLWSSTSTIAATGRRPAFERLQARD